MAYIRERKTVAGSYFYLMEGRRCGDKVKITETYLGINSPIAKSRGWKGLSPKIVAWLKERAKQKTKPIPIQEGQKGKYRVIVIDPPWPMERVEMVARTSELPFDYPTMSLKQIENNRKLVPIRKFIDKTGCFIFLWTTQKFLAPAFKILEGWGARCSFTMVWNKGRGRQLVGLPQFNCEFVLVGRIGKVAFTDTKAFKTSFEGLARRHSQKPEEFYELVNRITPGPRIDMFSREKHKGFDQWGNELEKLNEADE